MNIIISPEIIALLRNSIVLVIIYFVGLILSRDYGYLYQFYFLLCELAFTPLVAMIATKGERQFGFLLVTFCTWWNAFEVYNLWQHNVITYNNSKWDLLTDTLFLWGQGLIFSLIGTYPIFLWRRWNKRPKV